MGLQRRDVRPKVLCLRLSQKLLLHPLFQICQKSALNSGWYHLFLNRHSATAQFVLPFRGLSLDHERPPDLSPRPLDQVKGKDCVSEEA